MTSYSYHLTRVRNISTSVLKGRSLAVFAFLLLATLICAGPSSAQHLDVSRLGEIAKNHDNIPVVAHTLVQLDTLRIPRAQLEDLQLQYRLTLRHMISQCLADNDVPPPHRSFYDRQDASHCLAIPEDCLCGYDLSGYLDPALVQPVDMLPAFAVALPKSIAQYTLARIWAKAGVQVGGPITINVSRGLGFSSAANLRQFVRTNFTVLPRMELHHIVEQRYARVFIDGGRKVAGRFSPYLIHNTQNSVMLPQTLHRAVSAYYSKKWRWSGNRPARDWMAERTFEEQFSKGVAILGETFNAKLVRVPTRADPNVWTWEVANLQEVMQNLPQVVRDLGLNVRL